MPVGRFCLYSNALSPAPLRLSVKLYVATYNLRMKAALFLAVLTVASVANAQGIFQNMNFELANVPGIPAGQYGADVPTSHKLSPDGLPFMGQSQAIPSGTTT